MSHVIQSLQVIASEFDITPLPQVDTSTTIPAILSIVFGIVGGLALLFIVISGFRYIVSAGDPQKTAKAKDGIIYALIGLAVAIAAEAIVTLVIKKV